MAFESARVFACDYLRCLTDPFAIRLSSDSIVTQTTAAAILFHADCIKKPSINLNAAKPLEIRHCSAATRFNLKEICVSAANACFRFSHSTRTNEPRTTTIGFTDPRMVLKRALPQASIPCR